jgi:hypothetical protein
VSNATASRKRALSWLERVVMLLDVPRTDALISERRQDERAR